MKSNQSIDNLFTNVIKEDAEIIVSKWDESFSCLRNTTLLLTGAGGFLGTFILDVLKVFNDRNHDAPCKVIALDLFSDGIPNRLAHLKENPHIEFVTGDVINLPKLDLGSKLDWIIHGACIASPIMYRQLPLETIDANVNGTWKLLELAKDYELKGFLFISSSEIYGDPDPACVPLKEEYTGSVACMGPRACYDESKRLGETLCWNFHQKYNIPITIVRPFNVYGPGQGLDDGRILPDLIGAAIRNESIVLYSDGRPSRSFCYIRDFVAGLMNVLIQGKAGEAYNVGNTREITINDLAHIVADCASESPLNIAYKKNNHDAEYLTDNPNRRCPNIEKVVARTGWQPNVDLKEGIVRTLTSYRELNF